jgi:hypothetical protein
MSLPAGRPLVSISSGITFYLHHLTGKLAMQKALIVDKDGSCSMVDEADKVTESWLDDDYMANGWRFVAAVPFSKGDEMLVIIEKD